MDYCDCEKVRDLMNTDYKNWMPKGMVLSSVVVTMLFLILFIIFGLSGIV